MVPGLHRIKCKHLNLNCCHFAPLFYYYLSTTLLVSCQFITVQQARAPQYDQFQAAISVLFPGATDISSPCPHSLCGQQKPEDTTSLNTYSKFMHSHCTHISVEDLTWRWKSCGLLHSVYGYWFLKFWWIALSSPSGMKEPVTAINHTTWILNISAFKTSNITQHLMYLHTQTVLQRFLSYTVKC